MATFYMQTNKQDNLVAQHFTGTCGTANGATVNGRSAKKNFSSLEQNGPRLQVISSSGKVMKKKTAFLSPTQSWQVKRESISAHKGEKTAIGCFKKQSKTANRVHTRVVSLPLLSWLANKGNASGAESQISQSDQGSLLLTNSQQRRCHDKNFFKRLNNLQQDGTSNNRSPERSQVTKSITITPLRSRKHSVSNLSPPQFGTFSSRKRQSRSPFHDIVQKSVKKQVQKTMGNCFVKGQQLPKQQKSPSQKSEKSSHNNDNTVVDPLNEIQSRRESSLKAKSVPRRGLSKRNSDLINKDIGIVMQTHQSSIVEVVSQSNDTATPNAIGRSQDLGTKVAVEQGTEAQGDMTSISMSDTQLQAFATAAQQHYKNSSIVGDTSSASLIRLPQPVVQDVYGNGGKSNDSLEEEQAANMQSYLSQIGLGQWIDPATSQAAITATDQEQQQQVESFYQQQLAYSSMHQAIVERSMEHTVERELESAGTGQQPVRQQQQNLTYTSPQRLQDGHHSHQQSNQIVGVGLVPRTTMSGRPTVEGNDVNGGAATQGPRGHYQRHRKLQVVPNQSRSVGRKGMVVVGQGTNALTTTTTAATSATNHNKSSKVQNKKQSVTKGDVAVTSLKDRTRQVMQQAISTQALMNLKLLRTAKQKKFGSSSTVKQLHRQKSDRYQLKSGSFKAVVSSGSHLDETPGVTKSRILSAQQPRNQWNVMQQLPTDQSRYKQESAEVLPEPFTEPHYKCKDKAESFSRKGYGVGFVSKVNRFGSSQDELLALKDRMQYQAYSIGGANYMLASQQIAPEQELCGRQIITSSQRQKQTQQSRSPVSQQQLQYQQQCAVTSMPTSTRKSLLSKPDLKGIYESELNTEQKQPFARKGLSTMLNQHKIMSSPLKDKRSSLKHEVQGGLRMNASDENHSSTGGNTVNGPSEKGNNIDVIQHFSDTNYMFRQMSSTMPNLTAYLDESKSEGGGGGAATAKQKRKENLEYRRKTTNNIMVEDSAAVSACGGGGVQSPAIDSKGSPRSNRIDRANSCISHSVTKLFQKHKKQSETWERMRKTAMFRKEICSPRLYVDPNSLEEQLSTHTGDYFTYAEPDTKNRTMQEALSQGDHSYAKRYRKMCPNSSVPRPTKLGKKEILFNTVDEEVIPELPDGIADVPKTLKKMKSGRIQTAHPKLQPSSRALRPSATQDTLLSPFGSAHKNSQNGGTVPPPPAVEGFRLQKTQSLQCSALRNRKQPQLNQQVQQQGHQPWQRKLITLEAQVSPGPGAYDNDKQDMGQVALAKASISKPLSKQKKSMSQRVLIPKNPTADPTIKMISSKLDQMEVISKNNQETGSLLKSDISTFSFNKKPSTVATTKPITASLYVRKSLPKSTSLGDVKLHTERRKYGTFSTSKRSTKASVDAQKNAVPPTWPPENNLQGSLLHLLAKTKEQISRNTQHIYYKKTVPEAANKKKNFASFQPLPSKNASLAAFNTTKSRPSRDQTLATGTSSLDTMPTSGSHQQQKHQNHHKKRRLTLKKKKVSNFLEMQGSKLTLRKNATVVDGQQPLSNESKTGAMESESQRTMLKDHCKSTNTYNYVNGRKLKRQKPGISIVAAPIQHTSTLTNNETLKGSSSNDGWLNQERLLQNQLAERKDKNRYSSQRSLILASPRVNINYRNTQGCSAAMGASMLVQLPSLGEQSVASTLPFGGGAGTHRDNNNPQRSSMVSTSKVNDTNKLKSNGQPGIAEWYQVSLVQASHCVPQKENWSSNHSVENERGRDSISYRSVEDRHETEQGEKEDDDDDDEDSDEQEIRIEL